MPGRWEGLGTFSRMLQGSELEKARCKKVSRLISSHHLRRHIADGEVTNATQADAVQLWEPYKVAARAETDPW